MDNRLRYALILSIPLWGTLFPWLYNQRDPELAGIPFFYWYQLMWIPLSVACTLAVYSADRVPPTPTGAGTADAGDDRLAGC